MLRKGQISRREGILVFGAVITLIVALRDYIAYGLFLLLVILFSVPLRYEPFSNLGGTLVESWTDYAPGFSFEKFNTIEPGMTAKHVVNILGRPLRSFASTDNNSQFCYQYSRDGGGGFLFWEGWVAVGVCFDGDGRVNHTYRAEFGD